MMTAVRPCVRWLLVILLCSTAESAAQEHTAGEDSLRTWSLEEIIIGSTALESERRGAGLRVQRIQLADVAAMNAAVVPDVLRTVSGLHVQTNSRGETLAYMRGAGERQTEYLLNGVPLNIPWDNRFDLGALPAALIGSVAAVRSAAGPRLGVGGAGGVLLLTTRAPTQSGSLLELSGKGGSGGLWQQDVLWSRNTGNRSILFTGSYVTRKGIPTPAAADVPLDGDRDLRLNSDRTSGSGFLSWQEGRTTLMALHAESEAGVAPEGHLTTVSDPPRRWKYPVWRNSIVSIGRQWAPWVKNVFWLSRFEQHIDEYPDLSFRRPETRQEDLDVTMGARLLTEGRWGGFDVAATAQLMTSRHEKTESTLQPEPRTTAPEQFREHNGVLGVDAAGPLSGSIHLLSGASLEWKSMPETGLKPGVDGFQAGTGYVSLQHPLGSTWTVGVTSAREVRMPTMRELFDGALDRFLLNAELEPEVTHVMEAATRGQVRHVDVGLTVFRNRTFNTIDQENVVVDGVRKRRRINLQGSRLWGVELTTAAQWPSLGLQLRGHGTWMRPVELSPDGEDHLAERPEILSQVAIRKALGPGFHLGLRVDYTGRAWARTGSSEFVALPTAWRVHPDITYRRFLPDRSWFLEVAAGANNVFDAVLLPQLGLPAAGQSFFLRASFTR